MRARQSTDDQICEQAEILALRALAFVLADDRRAERFLSLTGIDPARLRSGDIDSPLHEGVLDFLLGDEPMLLEFCDWAEVDAEAPAAALRAVSRDRREG